MLLDIGVGYSEDRGDTGVNRVFPGRGDSLSSSSFMGLSFTPEASTSVLCGSVGCLNCFDGLRRGGLVDAKCVFTGSGVSLSSSNAVVNRLSFNTRLSGLLLRLCACRRRGNLGVATFCLGESGGSQNSECLIVSLAGRILGGERGVTVIMQFVRQESSL